MGVTTCILELYLSVSELLFAIHVCLIISPLPLVVWFVFIVLCIHYFASNLILSLIIRLEIVVVNCDDNLHHTYTADYAR